MAYQTFRQEYMQMPVVTRAYTTACVITTLAVQLDLVSPFQLYFNPILIVEQYQLWRLITTFLFFGAVGFNFFFNIIFTYRYCRMLEEGSFRGRTADFVMMFLFGGICMIVFAFFVNLLFLGQAFTIMLVYVWSRRNPFVRMNFFGLINFQTVQLYISETEYWISDFYVHYFLYGYLKFVNQHKKYDPQDKKQHYYSYHLLYFQAPYLPWVLLGFSVLLGNAIWVDLMGMAVGHMYYFVEDVFPNQRGGFRLLNTPQILKALFDAHPQDPDYTPLPEDRPGGFNWGERPPNQQ